MSQCAKLQWDYQKWILTIYLLSENFCNYVVMSLPFAKLYTQLLDAMFKAMLAREYFPTGSLVELQHMHM